MPFKSEQTDTSSVTIWSEDGLRALVHCNGAQADAIALSVIQHGYIFSVYDPIKNQMVDTPRRVDQINAVTVGRTILNYMRRVK